MLLDDLQKQLTERKNPSASQLADYANHKMLDGMFNGLESAKQDRGRFEDVAKGVGKGLKDLSGQLKGVEKVFTELLGEKPNGFGPVLEAISSLEKAVNGMTKAIGAIELPKAAPFPEIPEVDLTGLVSGLEQVLSEITTFRSDLESMQVNMLSDQPKATNGWIFDVKRKKGLMDQVIVTPQ